MDISDARQGFGYGRALMGDLVDAGKLMGIERIKLRAERVGRYVWVRMGFLPTDDAWLQMRREAFDFIVKHRLALEQKLDVMDLMSRILAGGPKMARTLAAIDVDVPSSQIPARFEPELMPFGKVFFLEIASPWSGALDLCDVDVDVFGNCTERSSILARPQGTNYARRRTRILLCPLRSASNVHSE